MVFDFRRAFPGLCSRNVVRPAAMEWSGDHDVMLCRKILYEDPFQLKKGSPDRGEVWSKIARALNRCVELKLNVK